MKKIVFLMLFSGFIAVSLAGCGYNASYTNYDSGYGKLNAKQVEKLNNIMFIYLDIPKIIKFVSPPPTQKVDRNYYQPSAVIKAVKVLKYPAEKTPVNAENKNSTYSITAVNNTLFLKIFSRKAVLINKTFNIEKVDITIKKIKYDKGYEVASIALKNTGKSEKTVMENFKYSNAGNSFELKKYEVIKNLTVANRYKKGEITLWLKF